MALTGLLFSCQPTQNQTVDTQWRISAPADTAYTRIDRAGRTVLPNGRFVTPRGRQISVAPHPYGLVLSPDGQVAVTANSGTKPFSISIINGVLTDQPSVRQVPPGADNGEGILASVFMGLAVSPDNQTVYVAGGQENKIYLFDVATGQAKGAIDCATKTADRDYSHGYLGDLVLTRDGKTLYVVDQIGFRLVVVDVASQKIRHNVPTGRYPFGLALTPNEQKIYVANVGMYEYQAYESVKLDDLKNTTEKYPAFAYGSKEAEKGIDTDSVKIPGLGDPNSPEAFSVWAVDLANPDAPKVTAKVKTGFLVGEIVEGIPAVGGASPNSIVATNDQVFVSNGTNDCISVIDPKQDKVVKNIFLKPDPRLAKYRGVIPFGLALAPDGQRLYVAEAGINAVGVVDTRTHEVLGHLPTGWFPSKLKVSNDGKKLIVANAKGYGSGPNGGAGFVKGPEGSYVGGLMKGTVSVMDLPTPAELQTETEKVIANNFSFTPIGEAQIKSHQNPIPLLAGAGQSPIRYIVFISKENRTYDEVFGQVKNGRGDPALARFGAGLTVENKAKTAKVTPVDVMPNHLALAKQFAISDNFYCDSDHSADGHRWLVCTYPNEWMETSVSAAYGGKRDMKLGSKAPGNLALVGASGAIYPEDYNEAGSLWEHLERHQVPFFNFGFGLELAATYSDSTLKYTGVQYAVNYPVPAPIFDKSSRTYATYNMGIPDQFRADQFMAEYKEKWLGEGKEMPRVLTILLPNDHGSKERPADGFPFQESYMADNDLALGRIVEFLSQTPYWKNMAIVVTEDDPQGGVDHVDAHRSLLMVISPYAKPGHVGHQHYSFGSIFKTFWQILGLPALNQYDAGSTDLADLFQAQPNLAPYRAKPVDARIFDPQKALNPFDEKFNWKAVAESEILDEPEEMKRRGKQ